jgi:hypothetical protein
LLSETDYIGIRLLSQLRTLPDRAFVIILALEDSRLEVQFGGTFFQRSTGLPHSTRKLEIPKEAIRSSFL